MHTKKRKSIIYFYCMHYIRSMPQFIRIQNYIISKNGEILQMFPLRHFNKKYPQIQVEHLPLYTEGNKVKDNKVLSKLSSGKMKWNQLN